MTYGGPVNDLSKVEFSCHQHESALGPTGAFETAKGGGKHSGFLRNYADKPPEQIQKGINSIKKEIAKHQDKIANPQKYIPDFDKLDPRQQNALVTKKWPSDIARQQEQLDILEGLLQERRGG